MPIQWPPLERGVQYAPQDGAQAFTSGADVTNLALVGTDFDGTFLAPGFGFGMALKGVNTRNIGSGYEAQDINTMAPAAVLQYQNPTDRGVYNQTDWYLSNSALSGTTRDSSGAVLASCQVDLFTANDDRIASVVSDGSGNFSFSNPGTGPFYIVAYKPGAPDVAGTSVNTLLPTLL